MIYGSINLTNLKAIFAKNSKKERNKKNQRNNEYLLHFRTNGIIALQLEAIHANPFSNLSFLGNESLEPNRNAFESRLVSHILFISCISFGFNIFVQSYLSLSIWLMVQLHWVPYHVTNSPFIPIHIACVYI